MSEPATQTTLRKLIKEYTLEERKNLLPSIPKCKRCGKELVSKKDYELFLKGSWKTKPFKYALIPKIVNNKMYFRKYCEDCIKKEFGNIKRFNTFNEQVIWALEIPENEAKQEKKNKYDNASLESFKKRFGEKLGIQKYKEYCERQAYTNSFEYKKEKYGWTEKEYKKYNLERAVTLENMIKRYGEEKGRKKWEKYIQKQQNVFNKLKSSDKNNEIIQLNEFILDSMTKYIFSDKNLPIIYNFIKTKYKIFYQDLNFEYFLFYKEDSQIKRVFYDITIPKIKLILELDNKNSHKGIKEIDNKKNIIAKINGFTVIRIDDDLLINNTKEVLNLIQNIINFYEDHYEKYKTNNKLSQIINIIKFDDIEIYNKIFKG